MPKQEIQHQSSHADQTNGPAAVGQEHEQKLYGDAYHGAGHAVEAQARGHNKSDEKLKSDYVEGLMETFKKRDANHDGKLTVEEVVKYDRTTLSKLLERSEIGAAKTEMAEVDLDHNGIVTLKDYEKGRGWTHQSEKQLAAEFKAMDTNGDGHLSFSEIKGFEVKRNAAMDKLILNSVEALDRKNFQSMDVNHDGKISLAEYIAPSISMPAIWASRAVPAESGPGAPPHSGGDSSAAMGAAAAAVADAVGSGERTPPPAVPAKVEAPPSRLQ